MSFSTPDPRPLIGPAELAVRLGVSRDHIYRMKDRGTLPTPVRLGHLIRWDPEEIEDWLRAGARDRPSSPRLPQPASR